MQDLFPRDYSAAMIAGIFAKLLISAVLGGIVGYERETHERPAGLRTHVLVCLGATLFMILSISFRNDPVRIAAQIVTGIGFLGAGTILHQGTTIKGLTTAASLWIVSAIGMAVGIGGSFFIVATFCAFLVFATLSGLRRFEPYLGKKNAYLLTIHYSCENADVLSLVLECLSESGVELESILSGKTEDGCRTYAMRLSLPGRESPEAVIKRLEEVVGLDRFRLS